MGAVDEELREGVRFFKLTTPMGRGETGNLMEWALIPKCIPLNLKYKSVSHGVDASDDIVADHVSTGRNSSRRD